ncbi:MAG: riboflavin kinase [Bacteroidales bacterium]|nr:riboflavin kinase [Bacteroidales bacterium]
MSDVLANDKWLHGRVIHGYHNGTSMGFPTANIELVEKEGLEKGVYAVQVLIAEQYYGGMMYIGTRPTLDLEQLSIEINLFDFSEDIYGQEIEFRIINRIRGEQRFKDLSELVMQLKNDREEAIAILKRVEED